MASVAHNFPLPRVVCAVLVLTIQSAVAATFVVTHAGNDDLPDGSGEDPAERLSLRGAIEKANANPGLDRIEFNINGQGPHTITPLTPLPEITDPVIIDGYTQPGSVRNSIIEGETNAKIMIEINGELNPLAAGLVISSGGSTVAGLAIYGFSAVSSPNSTVELSPVMSVPRSKVSAKAGSAIHIKDNGGNEIYGNFIGIDSTRQHGAGNWYGILIEDADENKIGDGGDRRNLLDSNDQGIELIRSSGNEIKGNVIIAGGKALTGIQLDQSRANLIGSANIGSGNHITGRHTLAGISLLFSSLNRISSNKIESSAAGISFLGSSFNVVGDGTTAGSNLVIDNDIGLEVSGFSTEGNLFTVNSIHKSKSLGISLGGAFQLYPTPVRNDPVPDADSGPNRLQNFPILQQAVALDNGQLRINGYLESAPNRGYRIEFFSNSEKDPSRHGEGETYLGFLDVFTDGSGRDEFEVTFNNPGGDWISSTATENYTLNLSSEPPSGSINNTSEFSPSIPVAIDLFSVLSPDSSGPGTLLDAINQANAASLGDGYVIIEFNIPDDGPKVIELPDGPLILERKKVIIDGFSQPGSKPNQSVDGFDAEPQIQLDGSQSSATGIRMEADDCHITGLSFVGFTDQAIDIWGSNNSVSGCSFGVHILTGEPAPNGSAICLSSSSEQNLVGGTSPTTRNHIINSTVDGVCFQGMNTMRNTVSGNLIENNMRHGINLSFAYQNEIGQGVLGHGNRIINNGGAGIRDASQDGNAIRGNYCMGNAGLPVDVGSEGANTDDVPDIDGIANIPIIESATVSPDGRTIRLTGQFHSPEGAGNFAYIDLYRVDSRGAMDGGQWIGSTVVPLDADGETTLDDVEVPVSAGQVGLGVRLRAAAVVASVSGGVATSELSPVLAAAQAFSLPRIAAIHIAEDSKQIYFPTNYGSEYALHRTSDLQPSGWDTIASGVEGTGDLVVVEDSHTGPAAFYQLEEALPDPNGSATFETVARSGQGASGSDRSYLSFRVPTINLGGEIAFVALTESSRSAGVLQFDLYELFHRSASGNVTGRLIASAGATVGLFKSFLPNVLDNTGPFPISDSGEIAATAEFFANTAGLGLARKLRVGSSEIDILIGEGDLVRSGSPDQLYWENAGRFSLPIRINDSGKYAFAGVYRNDGTITSSGAGIHTDAGIVVRDGDPVPNLGGTFSGVGSPVINDADEIAFSGRRTHGDGVGNGNDGVLVVEHGGAFTTWLVEGEAAPGYPKSETKETHFVTAALGGLPFDGYQLTDAGLVAFGAALGDVDPQPGSGSPTVYSQYLLGTGYEAIYYGSVDAPPTLAVAQEQAASIFGQPSRFINGLSWPVLSNSGYLAFTATYGPDHVSVAGKGLFVLDTEDGSVHRIYMTGDSLGESIAFGPNNLFQSVNEVRLTNDHNAIAINQNAELAFLAAVEVGTEDRLGLFYANEAGELTTVALEGEIFEPEGKTIKTATQEDNVRGIGFQGGSNSSGGPTGFNDFGQIVFRLVFTDGTSGLYVFNPPGF